MSQPDTQSAPDSAEVSTFDVLIIGAGASGMRELMLIRDLGLSVRVLEAAPAVGGTWYWNRYPGARLDSESFSYQYSFSQELLEEWDWQEMFAGQPELERYFNRVADKFDLRRDIDFDTRVERMIFDEAANQWHVTTTDGARYVARFVITATGVLSAPQFPAIPGLEDFRGEWYHTGQWPDEDVDFTGKRVVVIGTGASGVQVITEIGKTAGHLTVFQRTPNWAVPLRNSPIDAELMQEIRAGYPEMFERMGQTFSGFLHDWDPVASTDVSVEERDARFERAWNSPGFAKWTGMYHDIARDAEANQIYCDFLADKIRERVRDPKTAEMLIPKDHLFGTKRVPCESGYFETYNRDNVELMSLSENPIERFTEDGLATAQGEILADIVVFATGFEAFTGALNRIDIHGVDDLTLREKWSEGPVTYLGIQVSGFPNLFIMGGPHGKGGHGNSLRCSERVLEWMARLAEYAFDNGVSRIEADPVAEAEWTEHVVEEAMKGLGANTKSYVFGDNVPGRRRTYLAYVGSLPEFVQRLKRVESEGYAGFITT
ncbi:flavin-containing monooxygenase [Gordonia terrae]|uniref:flavin-containing monooxygenase n=1 Tax=Gordonia terrae TaxID=2055 RepID=UPI003F6B249D